MLLVNVTHVVADPYKPSINPVEFESYIYSNEDKYLDKLYFENDEGEIFFEAYFKDDRLNNEYSILNQGYLTYSIYEKNNLKKYQYSETFYDCGASKLFTHQLVFNSEGNYIFSRAFFLDFEDEIKPVSYNLCQSN